MSRVFIADGPIRSRGRFYGVRGKWLLVLARAEGKWAFGSFVKGSVDHTITAGSLGKVTVPSRWYQIGSRVFIVGLRRLDDHV